MRRISRIDRSIEAFAVLGAQKPSYTCSACRRGLSTSTARAAKVSLTEKVRRKIWGTDQPPGLKDPYAKQSVLDQTGKTELAEKPRKAKRDPAFDEDYVKAESMEGLEWVGGFGHWWKKNWDPRHQFRGFLPSYRTSDSYEVAAALHRAVVEVYALQQAGRPVAEASVIDPWIGRTAEVQIAPAADGVSLSFTGDNTLEELVSSFAAVEDETAVKSNPTDAEADVAADRSTVDPLATEEKEETVDETVTKEAPTESEENVAADRSEVDPLDDFETMKSEVYKNMVASWDPSWLQTPLVDPTIKFAVLKRTMQLTGIRVSDAEIHHIKNVQALLDRLITPPKPRKVTEELAQSDKFEDVPNVKIYDRRFTPIDAERAVGRWKIIENELKKRGLPVTGN